MGKGWLVIIALIVIVGLFFYFKPSQTKEAFKDTKDVIGSLVTNYLDSRTLNLGRLSVPCDEDLKCNEYLSDCEGKCACISGDCIKNIQSNSS